MSNNHILSDWTDVFICIEIFEDDKLKNQKDADSINLILTDNFKQ